MPVSRMDSDRERILHYISRIGNHVRNVFSLGGNRRRSVVETMKTFTRRELVHTGIEYIRMRLRMYEETEDLEYISYANRMARTMGGLKIIGFEKQCLLYNIIDNEFKRLLEKRKSCAKRQTGQSQNQLDYNTGGLEME